MEKFLKIAGLIILQFLIGVVIFLIAIRIATNPEMHYAGSAEYEKQMQVADTPAEFEKGGAE